MVSNDAPAGTGDATLTALVDDVHGDITTTGHDGITATTCSTPQDIAGGGSYTCTFTVAVAGQPGTLIDTVTATLQNVADTVDGSDQANIVIADVPPAVSVTKTADPTQVSETGEEDVTFTYVVTNDSDAEAGTIVFLEDDRFPAVTGDADCRMGTVLPVDGSCEFTHTTKLASDDLTAHTNEITVRLDDDDAGGDPAEATDTATVTFIDELPDVSITKTPNPTSVDEPGGDVEFTIVVTNNGPEDITIDALTDSDYDLTIHCPDAGGTALDSGETYTCSFTEAISGNVGEDHQNTAEVTASDDDGNSVDETADAQVTISPADPIIAVEKSGPDSVDEGGDTATYTVEITNQSSATDPVTVTSLLDNMFGDLLPEAEAANGDNPIDLDPTESFSFSFDRPLSLNAGETHTNLVTACADDDESIEVCANDDHTVTGTDVDPQITVIKSADPSQILSGELVAFTVEIINNSVTTDPVTIQSLVDDIHGDVDCDHTGSGDDVDGQLIEPGESLTCSFEENIAADETDTVTVVAIDDEGTSAEAFDTAFVKVVAPSLEVTKTADPPFVTGSGEEVDFLITVENTGDHRSSRRPDR